MWTLRHLGNNINNGFNMLILAWLLLLLSGKYPVGDRRTIHATSIGSCTSQRNITMSYLHPPILYMIGRTSQPYGHANFRDLHSPPNPNNRG